VLSALDTAVNVAAANWHWKRILGRTDDMVCVRGVNIYRVPLKNPALARRRGGIPGPVDTASTLFANRAQGRPLPPGVRRRRARARIGVPLQTAFNLRIQSQCATNSLPRFEMKAQRWVRA